jgi:hypothetical protein
VLREEMGSLQDRRVIGYRHAETQKKMADPGAPAWISKLKEQHLLLETTSLEFEGLTRIKGD